MEEGDYQAQGSIENVSIQERERGSFGIVYTHDRHHEQLVYPEVVSNLYVHVYAMFGIDLLCSNEALPVTNHIGHLALWVWTHSIDYRYDELMLRVLILVVDTATREELPGFFKEAVLDKVQLCVPQLSPQTLGR